MIRRSPLEPVVLFGSLEFVFVGGNVRARIPARAEGDADRERQEPWQRPRC